MGERVAKVEEWIEGHEQRCEERYGALRSDVSGLTKGAWGLIAVIAGWLAVQLYGEMRKPPLPPQTVVIAAPSVPVTPAVAPAAP